MSWSSPKTLTSIWKTHHFRNLFASWICSPISLVSSSIRSWTYIGLLASRMVVGLLRTKRWTSRPTLIVLMFFSKNLCCPTVFLTCLFTRQIWKCYLFYWTSTHCISPTDSFTSSTLQLGPLDIASAFRRFVSALWCKQRFLIEQ